LMILELMMMRQMLILKKIYNYNDEQ